MDSAAAAASPRPKLLNVRRVGLALFLLASAVCLYLILVLPSETRPAKPEPVERHLRLVSLFQRHGDRAPSDEPPFNDKHAQMINLLWPEGLHNLTALGRSRLLQIGQELRRIYGDQLGFLSYDSSQVLALSSSNYRCVESAEYLLRGLFSLDQTKAAGRATLRAWHQCQAASSASPSCANSPPSGPGGADEWRKVQVDTELVPFLNYDAFNNCTFRLANPSPLDDDLLLDPTIRSLPGIDRLQNVMVQHYKHKLNFDSLGLLSTIVGELTLRHTSQTWQLNDHYDSWIELPLTGGPNVSFANESLAAPGQPTLFDLHEQVAVLGYEKRIQDEARYIQIGTLLASLIESQEVALGREQGINSTRLARYRDKRLIIYSSHDSILQGLLNDLGIVQLNAPGSSFESRFRRWSQNKDELAAFLSGLHLASYGLSVRFELIELRNSNTSQGFHIVEAHIYNAEDILQRRVHYRALEFGTSCRRAFKRLHPKGKLDPFYKQHQFPIDLKRSCPHQLLLNITAKLVAQDDRIRELCYA